MVHLQNPDLSAKISIAIPTQNAQEVVKFLVKHHISFSVDYGGKSPKTDAVSVKSEIDEKSLKTEQIPAQMYIPNAPKPQRIRDFHEKYVENIAAVSIPKIDEIAQELGMSATAFKSAYRTMYGKSFHQAFMEKRMERAAILLKQGHKANEVTKMVGYGENSAIKFNKMFQKHFGITPKKYQMEHYGSLNKRK
jgi:AraC-like DNA-binding protein